LEAGVKTIVSLLDGGQKELSAYSIAACGHDGSSSFGRIEVVHDPTNEKWFISSSFHKDLYQAIGTLYRMNQYGYIPCRRKEELISERSGSFLSIDIPSRPPKPRVERNIKSPDIAAYSLHILKQNRTTFDVAFARWMHSVEVPKILQASETVCFFCQQPTTPIKTVCTLLTRFGQYEISHIKRKCAMCSFTFKHSDMSTGILVYGSTAYAIGLMLDIDISLKNGGAFQPIWR